MLEEAYRHPVKYECELLHGIATLEFFGITSAGPVVTPENSDPRLPFGSTLNGMTCLNRDDCGIRLADIDGEPNYNWRICPANQARSTTGFLPVTKRSSEVSP
jgi:hypothetical protein